MATDAGIQPQPLAADAAALPVGYRINEYVIDRPLGGGGFGVTYLARDSNLQLPVAIKEYFPGDLVTRGADQSVTVRGANPEQRDQYNWGLERFLDEARALATFRHPNIVRVLRYFRGNGTAYIVMEYESGLSLKKWVPQNAPITRRELLAIIHPLMDGLEAVHKTGFLHRDIKPDNIYVRADNTPVLLDFGAARRVSANRDMTNIVSPGFAPFEQYHSQGNQGPWTDIYSLGAVMYWMVTGKKPVESAARVRQDSMIPATAMADAGIFGQELLEAIDWAVRPDEGRRPQSVAFFRAAIQGSEAVHGAQVDFELEPGTRTAVSPPAGNTAASAAARKTMLCTIMFLDLIGYSQRSGDDQVAVKKMFNDLLSRALKGQPEDMRIALDTGDGAAICFLGDPEEALQCAMLLRDLMNQRRAILTVRIGLHMGPVRALHDINDRVNVVGDGINVAQRVMDFAQANQILVSRAYYDVLSRITDDTADLFQYMGQHQDKHARTHEVYAVVARGENNTHREGPSTGYTQTRPATVEHTLVPQEMQDIEAELARMIGPLAKVLVKKAYPLASNAQQLRNLLAPSIQEARARELFVTASVSHPPSGVPSGRSHLFTPSQPSQRSGPSRVVSQPLSQPLSQPASQPASQRFQPSFSQPVSQPSRSNPSAQAFDISPQELAAIEVALSKFIGPMAKVLLKKELERTASFDAFLSAAAGNIDQPAQREEVFQVLKKTLPRR
ncbi:MAG: protein kinase [Ramlibacter sp.]|nr:protein kinase [Ramlibacter sp.]